MKNYNVTIGEKCFQVAALSTKSAKDVAQHHKRMQKLKGKTYIKLIK